VRARNTAAAKSKTSNGYRDQAPLRACPCWFMLRGDRMLAAGPIEGK
jgi:hypothetical protein